MGLSEENKREKRYAVSSKEQSVILRRRVIDVPT